MNSWRKLFLVILMTLTIVPVAMAQQTMYKWVDEAGTVHYGENPPEGVDAQPVNISAAKRSSSSTSASNAKAGDAGDEGEKSVAQQRRDERAEKAKLAREQDEVLSVACANQRRKLADLVPHTRVIIEEEDGSTRRLDDDERLGMIAEAQEFVDENCADY